MNREFHYPPQFRLGGHIITGVAAMLFIAFGALLLAVPDASASPWLLVAVAALGAILASFGRWMAHVHSGTIIMTETEVVFQRRYRQKTLAYTSVSEFRHTHKAFRTLILQGDGKKLCINKNLLDYQVFYDILRQKVEVLQRKTEGSSICFRSKAGETWLSVGLFLVLGLAICVGAWIGLFVEHMSIWMVILPNIILLPVIAAGFWWLMRYPTGYRFDRHCITVRSPAREKTYMPHRITAVRYGQKWQRIPRYGRRLVHFIDFTFKDGKKLSIGDMDTAYPIEDIAEFIRRAYQLEGKITEISITDSNDAGGKR